MRETLMRTLAVEPIAHSLPAHPPIELDRWMAFGAAAVTLMVLCRTHECYARRLYLGTFTFGAMSAVYGFAEGAWPLGLAVLIYSIASLRPLFAGSRKKKTRWREATAEHPLIEGWQEESRVTRLFGHG